MMEIVFDFQKLGGLLSSFYTISGVRYSLLSPQYEIIFSSGEHSSFCRKINGSKAGHERCVACDALAAKNLEKNSGINIYRCHAGALEVLLPILDKGEIIAYLFFGQMLSNEQSIAEQWQIARANLSWHSEPDSLKQAFYELKRLDEDKIHACAEILKACSSYIELEGLVKTPPKLELQAILAYIDDNYAQQIRLTDCANALSISKTKLCGILAQQDTSFTKLLRQKRIDVAKKLLASTNMSIGKISTAVGIFDYNYFSKVFLCATGMQPRKYRESLKKFSD